MTRLPVAALSVLDFCLSVLASRFVDSDSRQGRPYEVNDKPTSSLASGRDRVSLRLGSPPLPLPLPLPLPPSLPPPTRVSRLVVSPRRASRFFPYYYYRLLLRVSNSFSFPSSVHFHFVSISLLVQSFLFIRTIFSIDPIIVIINLVIFEIKS